MILRRREEVREEEMTGTKRGKEDRKRKGGDINKDEEKREKRRRKREKRKEGRKRRGRRRRGI